MRIPIKLARSAILLLLLTFTTAALAEFRIGSWNLLHFGWNNGKDYNAVAAIASQFDFLAVQELMKPAALARLCDVLEQRTGVVWNQIASGAEGRSTYQEHYGFIWRTDKVKYIGGAVSYLDTTDAFAREPFSALFQRLDTGDKFSFATVHIRFGDSRADRSPEIRALGEYWRWLAETYPDAQLRILSGDFNTPPGDPAWRALDKNARPLITRGGSTLSTTPGEYASLYDNFFVPDNYDLGTVAAGVLPYPKILGLNWIEARKHVSDHIPIYLVLGAKSLKLRGDITHASNLASMHKATCIDLNSASLKELSNLVHIGPARATAIVRGRPWGSVQALTRIRGLGKARVADIAESGALCPL